MTGKNIYQRIAAVATEVGKVEVTGSNQHRKPAISIEDTEDAIRDHLASNGIITRWSLDDAKSLGATAWLVELTVRFVNADDPEDYFEDTWADTGSNISAAVSFALKRYYKALFHLASAEDENDRPQRQAQRKPDPLSRLGDKQNHVTPVAAEILGGNFVQEVTNKLNGKNDDAKLLNGRIQGLANTLAAERGVEFSKVLAELKGHFKLGEDDQALAQPPAQRIKMVDWLEKELAEAQLQKAAS